MLASFRAVPPLADPDASKARASGPRALGTRLGAAGGTPEGQAQALALGSDTRTSLRLPFRPMLGLLPQPVVLAGSRHTSLVAGP